jgi:Brp/Blh family beta-carotene 15,15'-monooxygenase
LLKVLILLAGVVLTLVNGHLYNFPEPLQLKLFIAGVVMLGIPHGGADRLIALKNFVHYPKGFSKQGMNLLYLGNIILFSLLLICFPILGIITFLLLSAYHFGESDLQVVNTQTTLGKVVVFNYGLCILGTIFLPNFPQVQAGIHSLNPGAGTLAASEWIIQNNGKILTAIFILLGLNSMLYASYYKTTHGNSYVVLFQCVILLLILYNLPLLLSFTFYFVLWHSALSLRSILNYLREDKPAQSGSLIREIIKNSAIAIVVISIVGWVGYTYSSNHNITMYAVFGLAVLTASHMQVMHQMYRHLKSTTYKN